MVIDPFLSPYDEPSGSNMDAPVQGSPKAISLFELNAMVHAVVEQNLRRAYWITAELSEMRTASNGHCYLEFVQKDPHSGALLAKARGMIWRTNYRLLSDSFFRATGRRLGVGINVMVEVNITFHELYGYSLNVINIDPTYTLGDLAQRRKEILQMLEDDGVIDLNKELPLPKVIQRVAVISSATAAGYGDFCKQLQQSGLPFEVKLFPAVMQGDRVEPSVIAALDDIAAEEDRWDVVVIIRGGGAATDLNGFDSYLLASNVAQFPLPVLTGIGHERDDTILDVVAHTRFKTPTAVAAFLIESRENESQRLQELRARVARQVQLRMQQERHALDTLSHRISLAVTQNLNRRQMEFRSLAHRFDSASSHYMAVQQRWQLRLAARIELLVQQRLHQEKERLRPLPHRLESALKACLTAEHHRQDILSRSIRLAGPERILAMGFSITMKDGKVVSSPQTLKPGDRIVTRFAQGHVHSQVLPPSTDASNTSD